MFWAIQLWQLQKYYYQKWSINHVFCHVFQSDINVHVWSPRFKLVKYYILIHITSSDSIQTVTLILLLFNNLPQSAIVECRMWDLMTSCSSPLLWYGYCLSYDIWNVVQTWQLFLQYLTNQTERLHTANGHNAGKTAIFVKFYLGIFH